LNFISIFYAINISHAENDKEFILPNTRLKADGYCKETNTIYEFHGDYWHGNPHIYPNNKYNNTTKCTFGELYKNTLNKEQQIRNLGFNLITIWESDWIKLNKCVKLLQRKFRISKLN
jgi:G:T-mismatch repair DNA endonuclease (very short patch repair protein)